MSKSIKMKVRPAPAEYDLTASKFFGSPTIPEEWADDFDEDVIFLCQIRLQDIAPYDKENRLPHTGYLYIFLDTYEGEYDLVPIVRYSADEPDTVIEDFNESVAGYEEYTEAWLIEFEEGEEDEACTRLLGVPSDWNYEEEPPRLLMQFDPLDSDMGIFNHIDGFFYFLFGEDEKDFSAVTLVEEYS